MPRVVPLVTVLLLGPILAGCVASEDDDADGPAVEHQGIHLSPRAYTGADFTSFFNEAGRVGDTLAWSGDWIHLPRRETTADIVAERADAEGYRDVFLPTFFDPDTGQPVREVNETIKAVYVDGAGRFAAAHTPRYMGLGVDVDKLFEGNRSAYDDFVVWYGHAYAAIKGASPTTKVFPVFHYEHMKGLRGGLADGPVDARNATVTQADPLWHILDDFPQRDLTAFTSYPGLYHADPDDVPEDHYADLTHRVDGPLAITETGWHASPWPEGWESNVEEQGRFVDRLFEIVPPLEMLLWKHLFDQPGVEPYGSMGLVDHDRTPRPAWHAMRAEALRR